MCLSQAVAPSFNHSITRRPSESRLYPFCSFPTAERGKQARHPQQANVGFARKKKRKKKARFMSLAVLFSAHRRKHVSCARKSFSATTTTTKITAGCTYLPTYLYLAIYLPLLVAPANTSTGSINKPINQSFNHRTHSRVGRTDN